MKPLTFSVFPLLITSPSCHALLPSTLLDECRHSNPSPLRRFELPKIQRHDKYLPRLPTVTPQSTASVTILPRASISRLCATQEKDEEQHLRGIGVGIDLGTTNSAVAMMIPATDDNGGVVSSRRTLPAMIEIDDEGRTIPSVVAFVPASNDDQPINRDSVVHSPSLPPWTYASFNDQSETLANIQWPSISSTNPYQIHVGERAIEYEQQHPNSTYRNVKRIIGTGGKMAELSAGVVSNLFIRSINGNTGDDDHGVGLDSLDAAFDMSEQTKRKKGKKKKKKHVSKWKRKKAAELPKLQKQLEQARDDPALLTCSIMHIAPSNVDNTCVSKEVLLRPEQISACILRKLYDTAERYRQQQDFSGDEEREQVKVTRAVIGVPAYFTEAQRQATIRASELAGVPKVKLLPEPEAAALAYGAASNCDGYSDEELILVFDLGGGTFDVSILEVGGGVTEVLATVGNNRLGGTDLDKRVAEYLSKSALEYGRKSNEELKKKSSSFNELEESVSENGEKRRRIQVKDWYREGKGEVPDIILRTAEEVRKCLSNQKVVEVLVPLTEEGWRRVGSENNDNNTNSIGPFDRTKLETQQNMFEGQDYTIVSLDREIFESLCSNELQMLLQPIREVAIMAGVLLPGEARPSFVENAMAMASASRDDGEDFWEFENENDFDGDEPILVKTANDGASIDSFTEQDEDRLNVQTLQQIQAMDIKAQKKSQQRGRKKARDIDRRERSFRKQKQSAMEEAATASLLGTRLDDGNKNQRRGTSTTSSSTSSTGNERVQEGIHGRPLSRIVLVGGATRTPVVAKLLEAVVGMVPQRTVHPDEAVALGCAVQAGILDGENDGLMGGMEAVLSPMQAAVMRALARKRGIYDQLMMDGIDGGGDDEIERMMMGSGGISGMVVVDEFDDEHDFY